MLSHPRIASHRIAVLRHVQVKTDKIDWYKVKPHLRLLPPQSSCEVSFTVAGTKYGDFQRELHTQRARGTKAIAFLVQSFDASARSANIAVQGADAFAALPSDVLSKLWKDQEAANKNVMASSRFAVALAQPGIPETAGDVSPSRTSRSAAADSHRRDEEAEVPEALYTTAVYNRRGGASDSADDATTEAPAAATTSAGRSAAAGLTGVAASAGGNAQSPAVVAGVDPAVYADAVRQLEELRSKYNQSMFTVTQLDFHRQELAEKIMKLEKEREVSLRLDLRHVRITYLSCSSLAASFCPLLCRCNSELPTLPLLLWAARLMGSGNEKQVALEVMQGQQ